MPRRAAAWSAGALLLSKENWMLRKSILAITIPAAVWLFLASPGCGGLTDTSTADGGQGGGHGGGSSGAGSSSGAGGSSGASSGSASLDGSTSTQPPLTKVSKVDLLFDIDNSSSMADKQDYLAKAIPDLLSRLVSPNCVDAMGNVTGTTDANGHCATGAAEFPPVRDMHIGIVTSSLGSRLGDACDPSATQQWSGGTVSRHNDDQGHLINRGSDPSNLSNLTETALPDLGTENFLDWFPQAASDPGASPSPGASPVVDSTQLSANFQSLVVGAHQFGCGIESQLESWYRFLVQPDPYASLSLSQGNGGVAQWKGFDTVLLAQRADFLRPDSLVAVIVLSDENDSEVDVRSFSGSAWNFMSTQFHPPRGTSACANNPNSTTCTSCTFGGNTSDPQCEMPAYSALNDWGYDLNLRHVHQKQKYGISVQFPIQRYVLGLTSPTVPDRNGEYPSGAASYQGLTNRGCTNPLFAAKLPAPPAGVDASKWQPTADELCNLPPGNRGPGNVYYSHIGGVPHQLLQVNPSDPNSPQKATLTPDDWTLILGNDPLNEDYTGIDPHMVESVAPRTNVPVPAGGFPVSSPSAAEGTDPISGRESITDSTMPMHAGPLVDLQFACIFSLSVPRLCDMASTTADPTLLNACDCQPPQSAGVFTHEQVPAVCNDATPTQQDFAKAYPTIRELLLAKLLGQVPGANEGVISSICPIHTIDTATGTDPLYGYRPAMSAIVERLKTSLL
jgi:hypothetical protein